MHKLMTAAMAAVFLLSLLASVTAIADSRFAAILEGPPDTPFDAAHAPPAPDYADAANWAAFPGRRNASDIAPPG